MEEWNQGTESITEWTAIVLVDTIGSLDNLGGTMPRGWHAAANIIQISVGTI